MTQWLRQGTVTAIPFGPILDKGNGVDLETAAGIITSIDHAATGIMLSKNGGTLAVREQGGNFVDSIYDAHGCFKISLSAIDTGMLGRLRVIHTEPATYLAVWQDFMVVPAQVWDSFFGTDKLDVAIVEQANIDFGALQKLSLNSATPASVQNIPPTGSGFTTLLAAVAALQVVLVGMQARVLAQNQPYPVTLDGGTGTKVGYKYGEARFLTLAVSDALGNAVDLSGAVLLLGVKKDKGDAAYTFSKLDAAFIKTQATLGIVSVYISATDTAQPAATYVGELKCVWAGAEEIVEKTGDLTFEIKKAVTA